MPEGLCTSRGGCGRAGLSAGLKAVQWRGGGMCALGPGLERVHVGDSALGDIPTEVEGVVGDVYTGCLWLCGSKTPAPPGGLHSGRQRGCACDPAPSGPEAGLVQLPLR